VYWYTELEGCADELSGHEVTKRNSLVQIGWKDTTQGILSVIDGSGTLPFCGFQRCSTQQGMEKGGNSSLLNETSNRYTFVSLTSSSFVYPGFPAARPIEPSKVSLLVKFFMP
jgi:hypothetical protein